MNTNSTSNSVYRLREIFRLDISPTTPTHMVGSCSEATPLKRIILWLKTRRNIPGGSAGRENMKRISSDRSRMTKGTNRKDELKPRLIFLQAAAERTAPPECCAASAECAKGAVGDLSNQSTNQFSEGTMALFIPFDFGCPIWFDSFLSEGEMFSS